jgi:hypothetical protein
VPTAGSESSEYAVSGGDVIEVKRLWIECASELLDLVFIDSMLSAPESTADV